MSTAFVFPGQGSQSVGMLADIALPGSILEQRLGEASDVIGFDLSGLVANGPEEELNLTQFTQPALLASSVGLFEAFAEQGGSQPEFLAGHSLGEYSALVAAGSLNFSDGVSLVHQRGKLMQAAVSPGEGSMVAILGLDDSTVIDICESIEGTVSAANFNSPGQVVIAGSTAAVRMASDKCKSSGARRTVPLGVSVPSHCSLMSPAAKEFRNHLQDVHLNAPRVPIYHNVDAETDSDPDSIRQKLVKQLEAPVLWSSCVRSMIRDGASHFVECGPGRVLSGLMRRIDRSVSAASLGDAESFQDALGESS